MALSWRGRRKVLYTSVGIVLVLGAVLWAYSTFFVEVPTCADGKQNGKETGVDCGGSCALVCRAEARAPIVEWSRAFQTAPGMYTAAAYIKNPNIGAGARAVRYSFQLFNERNLLVVERTGVMDLPPVEAITIVEPNIEVGNRIVSKTLFSFSEVPTWVKVPKTAVVPLSLSGQRLAADGSRLSATLSNGTLADAKRVTVAAVLFDAVGVAHAASRTTLSTVPKRSSQDIVFTWPGGVPDIVRAEITAIPSF